MRQKQQTTSCKFAFVLTDRSYAGGPGRSPGRDAADVMNGTARVQRAVCGAAPHEDIVRACSASLRKRFGVAREFIVGPDGHGVGLSPCFPHARLKCLRAVRRGRGIGHGMRSCIARYGPRSYATHAW